MGWLLGASSRGASTICTPFPPAVSLGWLWGSGIGGQDLGLHTHLLGVLAVPPLLCSGWLSPPGRGGHCCLYPVMGVAEPGRWSQVTPTRRGGACQYPFLPPLPQRIAGGQSRAKKQPGPQSPYDDLIPTPQKPVWIKIPPMSSREPRITRIEGGQGFLPPSARPSGSLVFRAGSRSQLPSA